MNLPIGWPSASTMSAIAHSLFINKETNRQRKNPNKQRTKIEHNLNLFNKWTRGLVSKDSARCCLGGK